MPQRRPLGKYLAAIIGERNNGRTILNVASTTSLRNLDAANPNDRSKFSKQQRIMGSIKLVEYLAAQNLPEG